jgi:signal transduction histidine kinase/HPt (histidine-containing phosphotransfer) domain-containing protein/ActR/RegA family two-component response regulator
VIRRVSRNWIRVLTENYPQVCFVFAAFFFMVFVSYFSIGEIVRRQLVRSVGEVMLAAEANVRAGFAEAEGVMNYAAHTVQILLDENVSQKRLLSYLQDTTQWMRESQGWGIGLEGVYAYLHGEFIDGIGLNPGPEYTPQTRPWFDAAMQKADKKTAYTEPYINIKAGVPTISAVRNIYGKSGNYYGILVMDMDISWFQNYARSIRIMDVSLDTDGNMKRTQEYTCPVMDISYGIVLSQHMVVIGHPNSMLMNRQMQDICEGYRAIGDELMARREISTMHITDCDGEDVVVSFKRMFNGWYIGVAVSHDKYYRDVHYTLLVLISVGLLLMSILSYILLKHAAEKMRSDEENQSKTTFLAQMSHEIRTPMNAVIGLSELGLRVDKSPPLVSEYFIGIKHAGQNLLSIINDILDFSRIESGKLEISSSPYMLASLLNDVVNITRVRLSEKPIHFAVNVESAIPNSLVGDETRVRQVLLNILSNAVKYTFKGFILFDLTWERTGDGALVLKFEISDSGMGIRPEEIQVLFEDFVRFDAARTKGVEGTGLGLAITRRLCLAMGGDISASSMYGEGSVFTVTIPQSFANGAPLAKVEDVEEKSVLCYGLDTFYTASIHKTLYDLGVKSAMATDEEEFFKMLAGGIYPFTFVSSAVVERVRDFIHRRQVKTTLILLAGLDERSPFPDVTAIVMPAYAVSVANVLNRTTVACSAGSSFVSFIAPGARVLLVDDVPTNLLVAKGLLAPYGMQVDTCGGGAESLEWFRHNKYDLVLMDHMMPGMDGLAATSHIRGMEKGRRVPIVALTANAVSGMCEMFLQKGMDGFLSKPIDLVKLDEILCRWIPKEKQQTRAHNGPERINVETDAPFEIDGVDTKTGMLMSGGTEAKYRGLLEQYYRDVAARIDFLTVARAESALKSFTTQAHALKSASANIGAATLSGEAASLEDAGKRGDIAFIRERVESFRENLVRLIDNIGLALGEKSGATADSAGTETKDSAGSEEIVPLLSQLKKALATEDVGTVDGLLAKLSAMQLDSETSEAVLSVSDLVLVSDFVKAASVIDDWMHSIHRGKGERPLR